MDGGSARETAVVETGDHAARDGNRGAERALRTRRRAARRDQATESQRRKR